MRCVGSGPKRPCPMRPGAYSTRGGDVGDRQRSKAQQRSTFVIPSFLWSVVIIFLTQAMPSTSDASVVTPTTTTGRNVLVAVRPSRSQLSCLESLNSTKTVILCNHCSYSFDDHPSKNRLSSLNLIHHPGFPTPIGSATGVDTGFWSSWWVMAYFHQPLRQTFMLGKPQLDHYGPILCYYLYSIADHSSENCMS